MPVTATEVSIRFHRPPHDLFGVNDPAMTNALRFRIWPETRMTLTLAGKKPGAGRIPQLQELSFAEEPGSDMRPYDRLIGAALDGNRLPFARQDAVEAAWKVVDPVLDDVVPAHTYQRGSWGPETGRRAAARRAQLARPGRLIERAEDASGRAGPHGHRGSARAGDQHAGVASNSGRVHAHARWTSERHQRRQPAFRSDR